jgi:hypothetical protein
MTHEKASIRQGMFDLQLETCNLQLFLRTGKYLADHLSILYRHICLSMVDNGGFMAINERSLAKARDAGAKLAEAEHQTQLARSEYHTMVRRIHLAGASLREIAQALELSHQRVHQMVGVAGGSWWQRIWHSRNIKGNLVCTFCGRPEKQLAKLIAGPKVFICDACVSLADQSMTAKSSSAAGKLGTISGKDAKIRCSFCGKSGTIHRPLVKTPAANICEECLNVCKQILIDSTP